MVEVGGLVLGLSEGEGAALARAHVAELQRALSSARARMAELEDQIRSGTDSLAWMDWPVDRRSGEDGARAAATSSETLAQEAEVCRELARLAEVVARVAPLLVAAERLGIPS